MTRCTEIQDMVWTDGPESVADPHVQTCPTCSLEARRAGDLLAALRGMQTRTVTVPEPLEASLLGLAGRGRMVRVREMADQPRVRWGAAVGAAAAATAAVGLIVAKRMTARPELAA